MLTNRDIPYQQNATKKLVDDALQYIGKQPTRRAGLKGIMACGKTKIVSDFIIELSKEYNGNITFILLTIGAGKLPVQARISVSNNIADSGIKVCTVKDSLVEYPSGMLNCVVVAGWEELNHTDTETGKRINIFMRESENTNFPDLCKLTKNNNTPIILIIDEAHDTAGTDSSKKIIELIGPSYILNVSATLRGKYDFEHCIFYADVVKEQMVKDRVYMITFPHLPDGVREAANKLIELLDLAKRAGAKFFPKVLVFLPNDNVHSNELEDIKKILHDEYGWTEDKDIKVVLSDGKTKGWEACKGVAGNMDETKFLITKEAISTGIDIPSISIILQMRHGKSESAVMQKIGRGFRMPEHKHYSREFDKLNILYYIVDKEIKHLSWDGVEEFKNLQNCSLDIREEFKDQAALLKLSGSYYERRSPIGEQSTSTFVEFFSIPFLINLKKWQEHGKKFSWETKHTYKKDHRDWKPDTGELTTFYTNTFDSNNDDIKLIFDKDMRKVLNHLNKYVIEISDVVHEYMEIKLDAVVDPYYLMTFILNNLETLFNIIEVSENEASIEFDSRRNRKDFDYELKNMKEVSHDPEKVKETKKCLYTRYYQDSKHISLVESEFIDSIDNDRSYIGRNIMFWLKNYDSKYGKSFSITYHGIDNREKTFFPDIIAMLKDGRFGIFEVKDGDQDPETINKMNALVSAFSSQPNVLCGIVKFEYGSWYLYRGSNREDLHQDLMPVTVIKVD